MSTRLAEAAALIGETSSFEVATLGGGDLSEIWQVSFASGQRVVVKLGDLALTESRMLHAMARAGAPVPPVLAVQGDILVLGYIPPGGSRAEGWAALGHALRRLHDAEQPQHYGWEEDYAFGPMPISNKWADDWRVFWRESRLAPCLDFLPKSVATRVRHLADHLDQFLPQAPRPSLLHGDLWTGNFMTTLSTQETLAPSGQSPRRTTVMLIDPACYLGDASADFAILTLFATPPDVFWRAYGPLPSGYDTSIGVYRLWPALVHYRLFGEVYLGMVINALEALGL